MTAAVAKLHTIAQFIPFTTIVFTTNIIEQLTALLLWSVGLQTVQHNFQQPSSVVPLI